MGNLDCKNVMIVGRYYDVLDKLQNWLENAGYGIFYRAEEFSDAVETIETPLIEGYGDLSDLHLILMDMDSLLFYTVEVIDLMEILNENGLSIPVLLTSAPDEFKEDALQLGASKVLGEDYTENDVVEAVRSLIG